MVEFAGWEMPVQYTSVIEEHRAVRSRAGLFDVSHMGEIEVRGADAVALCQRVTANDVSRLKPFQAQYNLILNENGGIVDDVILYRLEASYFLFCVNAANTNKDFDWLRQYASGQVEIENASSRYAQLAIQGPLAEKILYPLTTLLLGEIQAFCFARGEIASVRCLVSRTGYTGEDGFELYCSAEDAELLWHRLVEAGGPMGLVPVGLGARDTLRLEKAYPLYGHELDDATTPLEARLEWVLKFSKSSFIGREVLLRQKENGVKRKLGGLELIDPGIARSDYPLSKDGRPVGRVTSGTKSPSTGRSIALGYMAADEASIGNGIEVEIRGRKVRAKVVPLPFYRR